MASLVPALSPRDRLDLLREIGRLAASGRWRETQQHRIGCLALGLGLPQTRALALDRWCAADCDYLLGGYAVTEALAGLLGDRLDAAAALAVRELMGTLPEAVEATPAAPEEAGGVLPPTFRLAGHTEREAALRALRPGATEEDRTLRERLGGAQRAHQAGVLEGWLAENPDAEI